MRKRVGILFITIAVVFFGILIMQFIKLSPILFQLLFNKDIQLSKTDERINILLLGIGGGKHEGPDLSDSIIFASVDIKSNKVKLISIPRDLWSSDLKAKVNVAYAQGEAKKKGGGLILASAVIGKIVGEPINYNIRLDFEGFVKAVDMVGGLDVLVERTFDDFEYPIEGKEDDTCGHTTEEVDKLATSASELEAFPCRYMHIHFDKGISHMDGTKALQFVRSRHAEGLEGTDFARSMRQQKVIQAFKAKALSVETLLNPIKVVGVYTAFSENIDTDIPQSQFDDFIKLAQKMKNTKVTSAVLDYGDNSLGRPGLLMHPDDQTPYNGQWVLIPRVGNGNFSEIHAYVDCVIKSEKCIVSKTPVYSQR